ncbi:hypothetical protein PG996_002603 [Apiospora saccharicola]|uniref:Uncharacterized protein n=1 Tax=Apiospora saccharicola TaxID=335842 RepID=A0ABR1WK04_9PEZI
MVAATGDVPFVCQQILDSVHRSDMIRSLRRTRQAAVTFGPSFLVSLSLPRHIMLHAQYEASSGVPRQFGDDSVADNAAAIGLEAAAAMRNAAPARARREAAAAELTAA